MKDVYVQMFSFEDRAPESTFQNLKTAAEIGYTGVELYGPNLKVDPKELKKALEETGLQAVSLHTGVEDIVRCIPIAKELGMSYVGIGSYDMPDFDALKRFLKLLKEAGEECRKNGLVLTYHNHTQEFRTAEGKTFLQHILDETDPAVIALEIDAGWCVGAGTDPIGFVKEHSGRVQLVHIKECAKVIGVCPTGDIMPRIHELNCLPGKGLIDWEKFIPAAREHGCRSFIVERETTYDGAADRIQCLREDFAYYSGLNIE